MHSSSLKVKVEVSCIINGATVAIIEAAVDADEAVHIAGSIVDAGNNNIPSRR